MELGTVLYRLLRINEYGFLLPSAHPYGYTWENWKVTKLTPKGYWITCEYGVRRKFQRTSAKARYALPTKDEAKVYFLHRKRMHIRKLEDQVQEAKNQLRLIEIILNCDAHDRLLPYPMA